MFVRTCLRLGYQMEPGSLPDLTPFQREIRRRVWTFIRQGDILLSLQNGLPSMLHPRWIGGGFPRNIHDDSLSRQTKELPPPELDSEETPVSFIVANRSLCSHLHKPSTNSGNMQNLRCPTRLCYASTTTFAVLIEAFPRAIRFRELTTLRQSIPSSECDVCLGGRYHQALCTVHSKFLKSAVQDPQHIYSWLSCLYSAMTLLSFQKFQD